MSIAARHASRIDFPRRVFLTGVVLVICALPAGCRSERPLEIGVILGVEGIRGSSLALKEINANGGIRGRSLRLREGRGAGDPSARIAIATAESLTNNPAVLAVIGHTNSSASLAASQVYNQRHVVQLAPTTTSPAYSDAGPYSFRLSGSDFYQGRFLAEQVLVRRPYARVAIFYVNDDYGRPLRQIVVSQLQAAGATLVYDSPYAERAGAEANIDMVASLARTRPEVLIWIGRAPAFVAMRALLQQAAPDLIVLASDGFSGGAVAFDTMRVLRGVSYVRQLDGHRHTPALDKFRDAYAREYGGSPSDQALLAYDCTMLITEAMRHGGPSREAIRDWLARVGREDPKVEGLSGTIAFTADGDREPRYFLETIGDSTPQIDVARTQ